MKHRIHYKILNKEKVLLNYIYFQTKNKNYHLLILQEL